MTAWRVICNFNKPKLGTRFRELFCPCLHSSSLFVCTGKGIIQITAVRPSVVYSSFTSVGIVIDSLYCRGIHELGEVT